MTHIELAISCVMRKPSHFLHMQKTKADISYAAMQADQCLCCVEGSGKLILVLLGLVGNLEDRFSHNATRSR